MKTTTVQYTRLANLGDYNNHRLSVTIELGEGESAEDGAKEAYKQVTEQLKALEEGEKEARLEKRQANRPWEFKPEMVADKPTLTEKAMAALDIIEGRKGERDVQHAKEAAKQFFGVDLDFTLTKDGRPQAVHSDMILTYDVYHQFTVEVFVDGEAAPRVFGYIDSLEDLGERLKRLQEELLRKAEVLPEAEIPDPMPF